MAHLEGSSCSSGTAGLSSVCPGAASSANQQPPGLLGFLTRVRAHQCGSHRWSRASRGSWVPASTRTPAFSPTISVFPCAVTSLGPGSAIGAIRRRGLHRRPRRARNGRRVSSIHCHPGGHTARPSRPTVEHMELRLLRVYTGLRESHFFRSSLNSTCSERESRDSTFPVSSSEEMLRPVPQKWTNQGWGPRQRKEVNEPILDN